jgi:glucuronoarabinoxylan endo-1,4-beta-xylanase
MTLMKKLSIFVFLLLLSPFLMAQTATINWTNVHQVIDGFGAGNVYYSSSMSSANQQFFFGTGSGQLGLSMLRVAVPNNGDSGGFGISCATVSTACAGNVVGDMQYAASQGARIYATAFSPPPIYTTNGSTVCSAGAGSGQLATGSYANFATWLSNFTLSVKNQGVNVYAMSLQNEPNGCWASDSTQYSASQLDSFIKNNLGPTLAGNGTGVILLTPETNVFSAFQSWGNTCATDASCASQLGGFNSHDYDASKSGYAVAADTYPSGWPAKKYWMTEASCFLNGSTPQGPNFCQTGVNPGMAMALNWAAVIDQRMQDGFDTYLYWWLISKNTDDEGLIDANGTVTSLAYVFGQYSKFVRPGFFRIDATHTPVTGETVSAYQNTSGSGTLAIIATNQTSSPITQTFTITNAPNFTVLVPTITSSTQNLATLSSIAVSGNSFTYTLPAQSVITFNGTGSATGIPWSGILSTARAIDWRNAGAVIPGGTISNCATQPSASITSINAAIAADEGGGSYCVINIPAGTIAAGSTALLISHAGQANIILKGAGANQTFLTWSGSTSQNCTGIGPTAVCITSGDSSSMSGTNVLANSATISSGYTQGSTTVNLSGFANLKVGSNLILMQQDPGSDNGNAYFCNTSGSNGTCSWQGSSVSPRPGGLNFSQTQTVYVTGCGTTTYGAACTSGAVTISSPIYAPNWTSGQSPHAWWANGLPITNVGVQDFSVDTSGAAGTKEVGNINNAQNVWIEGMRTINGTVAGSTSAYDHWLIWQSTHVTAEFNYMYGSAAQSGGYGIDFVASSSDSLAQSNITQHMDTGYITETAVGSVFGYNFATDNYYGQNWQQCDRYEHDAGDYYNLWEGDDGICIAEDDIHGSHVWNSYFREYASGFDPSTANGPRQGNIIALGFSSFARYVNVVNSVIGNTALAAPTTTYQNVGLQGNPTSCPSFPEQVGFSLNFGDGGNQIPFSPTCIGSGFTIDNDSKVASTLMRWNNYDVVTGAIRRCTATAGSPCTGDETGSSASTYPGLPSPSTTFPCSFYLSSNCLTPPWWSFPGGAASPFPANGGDVTGGSAQWGGHHYINSADYCYHTIMGGLDNGTSGALAFNRTSCFSNGTPTASAPTFTPSSPYSGVATTVTLASSTPGATFSYCQDTVNTCTPSTTGSTVSFTVTGYIRAFANASGYAQSSTSSWQGTIAGGGTLSPPTFSPNGSVDATTAPYFLPAQFALLVTPTIPGGSTGCYRLDGTSPTAPTAGTCGSGSTAYTTGSISVTANQTLKMLATEVGSTNSSVTSTTYNQRNLVLESTCSFNGGVSAVPGGTCTLSPTPSAGDGLTCGYVIGSNVPTATFTDNVSGTYLVANALYYGTNTFAASGRVYRTGLAGAPTTITMTLSSSASYTGFGCEAYKPAVAGTFTLDSGFVQAATTGNTANPSISSDTPSNANEAVYANIVNATYTITPTAGSGFTIVNPLPAAPLLYPEYQIQTTATATTLPYVMSADYWQMQPAAFYFNTPAPTNTITNLSGSVIAGLTAN